MPPTSSTCNKIRCLGPGVGSTMWGHQHKRELVSRRGSPTRQLPGTHDCFSGPQNLCHQSVGHDPYENRQHISSKLYQPEGRHSLNSTVQLSPGNMGMVSPETNITAGRASTRHSEYNSRHRIQIHIISVPTNTAINGSNTNRPICLTANQTATSLL